MTKLSSTFRFGFLGLFLLIGAVGGASNAGAMFLVVPVIMAVFGYFLFKYIIWDLVDEVYDGGDYLLIRNREDLIVRVHRARGERR